MSYKANSLVARRNFRLAYEYLKDFRSYAGILITVAFYRLLLLRLQGEVRLLDAPDTGPTAGNHLNGKTVTPATIPVQADVGAPNGAPKVGNGFTGKPLPRRAAPVLPPTESAPARVNLSGQLE